MRTENTETDSLRAVYARYASDEVLTGLWDPRQIGNCLMLEERAAVTRRLLRQAGCYPLARLDVLEIGCGAGDNLMLLAAEGADAGRLHGIDVIPEAIVVARKRLPNVDLRVADASTFSLGKDSVDLVLLYTVFSSVLDDRVTRAIVARMRDMLRPGGMVLWYDFFLRNPAHPHTRPMTAARIRQYFTDFDIELRRITLCPPLARRLGRHSARIYPVLARLPFLNSHYLGLFRQAQAGAGRLPSQLDFHDQALADSSRIKQQIDEASERTLAAASSQERKRVAIFLPTLDGGGAERAMINLANGMADTDRAVDLVVGNAAGPFRDELSDRVRLIDLRARRLLLAFPGLLRYLRVWRPARLYAALEEANVLALLGRMVARAPTKVYVSIRNTLTCELRAKPTMKNILTVRLARHLYPFADGIIAVSENAADDAATLLRLPRERITVIPNPVITPALLAKASEELNHPWFAPGQPPVVVGCGRLVPEKDFALLVRAFALVRQVQPARLLILGEGPQRADLQLLASDLGVIEDTDLPGFDANPFRYMSRAAVFVLCSRHEGSPNVVVQALACGCPVVSTDSPGDSRRILSGAQATSLVPVGDAVALAGAIRAFLRPDMSRPGPRLLPRFDYRSSAAAYLAVDHP